ncbi:hypothetical protein AOCH_000569 [Aspergillus ochraceoroseus]|uniref:Uncharacterized protein n=1 Tax=Aspergillus ochraceoroseus TaxID=138278 RepID=A0A0F8UJR4_9EURO|nr:hypothetical protein AOCH_000569 [Aspergillus ochraceoroseus]
MKLTAALTTTLMATSSSATLFDKWSPWGKRDYACINVVQGIPENATIAAGTTVDIVFDRHSGRCSIPDDAKAGPYNVWLANNPVIVPNGVHTDYYAKIAGPFPESEGRISVTIPRDLPAVQAETLWYLRLDTDLPDTPQVSRSSVFGFGFGVVVTS